MAPRHRSDGPSRRSRLLEEAADYCLSSLESVTAAALKGPTPCAGWDLEALLEHLSESLSALREGACDGRIQLDGPVGAGPACVATVASEPVEPAEPAEIAEIAEQRVDDLRVAIGALLREWQRIPLASNDFSISELPLSITVVEWVAAIEIAVHGWDIFESCCPPGEIPEQLARALLPVSSVVVDPALRPFLFAAPITIHSAAGWSDRLVASLGRRPRGRPLPG